MSKYINPKRGAKLRVLVDDAYLFAWKFQPKWGGYKQHRIPLSRGEIITYEGTEYSGGSDGIDVPVCSVMRDGKLIKSRFEPETWGSIKATTAEEVPDGTVD